ncbi:MAG: c-type cytochrome [Anaerolineae bacterium]
MKGKATLIIQYGVIALAVAGVYAIVSLLAPPAPAHALPEFATRTGEPCATCHVSPGGGGPRTLRGLLWAAQGRPDQVPILPNVLIAPGVSEGSDLYDIACAACHGTKGEGLFGAALADTSLRDSKIKSAITRGRERSGMPAFEGQFTDEQLDTLVSYVAGLSGGKIEPPPDTFPLAPGQLSCAAETGIQVSCGGN